MTTKKKKLALVGYSKHIELEQPKERSMTNLWFKNYKLSINFRLAFPKPLKCVGVNPVTFLN